MLFLYVFLFALPFAYSQLDSCTFYRDLQKSDGIYFNCLRLDDVYSMARCLLQVKSLEETMRCANWNANEALYFNLMGDSGAKDLDMLPYEDFQEITRWKSDNDGFLRFTPRGLILTAALACYIQGGCGQRLYSKVKLCPYEEMKIFISCLKCNGLKTDDMVEFEKYIRDAKYGMAPYKLTGPSVDWEGRTSRCMDGKGNDFRLYDVSYPHGLAHDVC